MGGNISCWSRSVHLDLDTRLAADGYVGNIVTIKVFGIRTVIFSVQAWDTFVVADTFPILIHGNRTLGGFGGIAVDEVTAGHVEELRMLLVGITAGR